MQHRTLGKTGWSVSDVGFGAWAVGGTWGPTDDAESLAAMNRALDLGVNLIDTADVYGDGHSERLIRTLLKDRREDVRVLTKAGRRLDPHVAEGYLDLERFVDRSRENLGMDTLDLVQLHCPPTAVYYLPEAFGALDDLVAKGKMRHWGVSVEKVEEGLKAMDYANCASVQIILNPFRQRPLEEFLGKAKRKDVGVVVRLPLSSGMLTGKLSRDSTFAPDDHRAFNREGAGFDRGETFSGVPYEVGLEAVEKLRPLVPEGMTMAQFALRWILDGDGVTCTIPGGKRPSQVEDNVAASDMPPLSPELHEKVRAIYDARIRSHVHDRW